MLWVGEGEAVTVTCDGAAGPTVIPEIQVSKPAPENLSESCGMLEVLVTLKSLNTAFPFLSLVAALPVKTLEDKGAPEQFGLG